MCKVKWDRQQSFKKKNLQGGYLSQDDIIHYYISPDIHLIVFEDSQTPYPIECIPH